ncbi:hypothetical protein MEX01_25540 [Methylorubrum extorquens]|nr:hypothetical protein MEX01_25540 [Methylorubrum extorquens]
MGRFVQAARPWSDPREAKPGHEGMMIAAVPPTELPLDATIREKIRERIALAGVPGLECAG